MGSWLRALWSDQAYFKKVIAGLAVGVGIAASTSAGAEVLDGDLMAVTSEEWLRFFIAVIAATFGAGLAAGGRMDGLKPDELELVRSQIATLRARQAAREGG